MGELTPGATPSEKPPENRLDSWKEIAAYLNRDVTTAQRWEKREGMPVHRHVHDRMGSVYAFPSELDAWRRSRRARLEQEGNEAPAEPPAASTSDSAPPSGDPGSDSKPAARMQRWLVVGGMALLAVVGVAYLLIPSRRRDAAQPRIQSLAVLPFKNLSSDAAQEYLSDGMTEAVIGRLCTIRGLHVISRTSVMGFKDSRLTVPEIAKALHVDTVVEGSVIREGPRFRVTAQLIRAATDEHFWSETYDRELGDALALQSDVAQSIASKVQVTITGEERARLVAARHVSPDVYEAYLKGRFSKGNSRADVEARIAAFEAAISKDPTFAPAYLGLADAYDRLGTIFIGAPPEEARAKVVSAARKALELDPDLADAHVVLAETLQKQWHWSEAEAEFHRALELNPGNAAAHAGLAIWLLCQGRTDEALAWAQRARELDPLGSGHTIAWILFCARRYDEALRELRTELSVRPDDVAVQWDLGFVLIADRQAQQAIPVLESVASASERGPGSLELLVAAYAQAGRRADALRVVEELKKRRQTGYVPAGAFVNAYLGLGDYEQAFVWFEHAYQEKSNLLQWVKVQPFFDPVRDDPRFKDLLHRVGLA